MKNVWWRAKSPFDIQLYRQPKLNWNENSAMSCTMLYLFFFQMEPNWLSILLAYVRRPFIASEAQPNKPPEMRTSTEAKRYTKININRTTPYLSAHSLIEAMYQLVEKNSNEKYYGHVFVRIWRYYLRSLYAKKETVAADGLFTPLIRYRAIWSYERHAIY